MSYLDTGPQRKEYSARSLFEILTTIQQAVNYMDVTNFPNGVHGKIIKPSSLNANVFPDHAIPMVKLGWSEFDIPLCLPASAFTTQSITPVNLGGYFSWDFNKFTGGDWYLEATIATNDAAATVTCGLQGSLEHGTVTTTSTSLQRVRSAKITMPSGAENLWVTIKISDGTKMATFMGARLIFVPY
jgi:hypothetical protein